MLALMHTGLWVNFVFRDKADVFKTKAHKSTLRLPGHNSNLCSPFINSGL